MVALDAELPQYGFAEHKGYCTPLHDAALAEHGPSRVHRYSFVNVRASMGAVGASALLHPPLVHNDAADEDAVPADAGAGGGAKP